MDITDKLQKKNKEQGKILEQYLKDFEDTKKIIKNKFNNKDGYFVLNFLKKNLFNKNNEIDINPNMLAFERGKQYVYDILYSLFDEEIIINYIKENGK